MPTTIKQIHDEDRESIETIVNVKVFKKLSDNMFIIVDDTGHALLETNQELEEGIVYKLLKPKCVNKIFEANPKLKILKTKIKLQTKALTKMEIKKYQDLVASFQPKVTTEKKADMNNFTKCEASNGNANIEMLTVLIVSKSGDIEGKYGKYNIVTAKDCNGNKNSINIYHDKTKIVNIEKLLTFTALKKTPYKQDNADYHRLATVWNTRIFESKEANEFKDVLLGDEKCIGIVLGYQDLKTYESCIKCSSKLAEDFCKKCQKDVQGNKVNDFYVTVYVQDMNDEESIIELFAFKKDLRIKSDTNEEFEKILDDMTDKTYIIEYNKGEDNGKMKLVKLQRKE